MAKNSKIKKINNTIKFFFVSLPVIALFTLITYWRLFQSFFEQDEWLGLGLYNLNRQMDTFEYAKSLFQSSGWLSHLTPISLFVFYEMVAYAGVNFFWYAAVSILLHIVASFTVFFLAYYLTKNKPISVSTGMVFAIHAISSQTITWIAASLATELATIFFVVSLLLYIRYIETTRRKWLGFSLLFYICSFLAKEITLTLFLVYPLTYLFVKHNIFKQIKTTQFLTSFAFLGAIVLSALGKYILFLVNPFKYPATIGTSFQFPYLLFIKAITYPLEALAQIYDFGGYIFLISGAYLKSEYPSLAVSVAGPTIVDTVVPDYLYLFFSFLLLLFFFVTIFIAYRRRIGNYAYLFSFMLLAFFVSVLPYVPLPKGNTFLELRYYYLPNVFASILITTTLYFWLNMFMSKYARNVLFFLIIALLVFGNYRQIQDDLTAKITVASERKVILSQFKTLMPSLQGKQNVFYVTGNRSDYLLEDLKVPFQSGFGNILMIWYYDESTLDAKMFDNGYLYGLTDQGYKQIGDYGFGYYFQEKRLLQDVKEHVFPIEAVHAFFWNSKEGKLLDITQQVKDKINTNLHEAS